MAGKRFSLSDYELSVRDGQFHLAFDGLWTETTMWELYALSILDELKTRAGLKKLREFGLDILYARAKTKLWGKIERLRGVPDLLLRILALAAGIVFCGRNMLSTPWPANLGSRYRNFECIPRP